MTKRSAGALPLAILATLAALLACGEPGSPPAGAPREPSAPAAPPNLLLVTLDTTRADRFAAWGGRERVTPHADRLAAEGVAFLGCVTAAPSTSPSHATMFTGLDPHQHGLRTNRDALPDDVATLAEALRAGGYRTAAFASVGFVLRRSELDRGFDVADSPPQRRDAFATTDRALGWMTAPAPAEAPFFAWVHYFDAHSPYDLTPWAESRLEDYAGEIRGELSVTRFGLGRWLDDPEDARAVRTRYDGLVNSADAQLGRLLEALEASGQLANTVVVLTADHGQALGEHRVPGHAGLWESILHVPLVVWDARAPTPRQVHDRVGLVDLKPTLLELAGLPTPQDVQGRSLAPALRGEPLEPRTYVSQYWPRNPVRPLQHEDKLLIAAKERRLDARDYDIAIYHGSLKLLDGEDGSALYDLARDPTEAEPLDPSRHTNDFESLQARIQQLRANAGRTPEDRELPEDLLESLRALGYVE